MIESGKIDRYWRTLAHLTVNGRDGRQYLVVVAGGHGSTNTKVGDAVIAYAPPKQAIRRMNRDADGRGTCSSAQLLTRAIRHRRDKADAA